MGILGHGRESVGIAVKATDVLFVLAWSNVAFTLRGIANLRPKDGGEAVPLTVDAAVTNDRLVSSGKLVIMQDGVIDSAAFAGLGGGPTQRGQTFAQFFITRGGASSIYGVLMAGYVYTGSQLGFGFIEEPGPAGGHGQLVTLALTDPAAGAEYPTQTTPTGAMWRKLSFSGTLVTSAAAGNRRPRIQTKDASGNLVREDGPGSVQPPSVTGVYDAGLGTGYSDTNILLLASGENHDDFPLADVLMFAGDTIVFSTATLDVGDNWGPGFMRIMEWVMPN